MCFISFGSDSDEEKEKEAENEPIDSSKKAVKLLIRKSLKLEDDLTENNLEMIKLNANKKQSEAIQEVAEPQALSSEKNSAKADEKVSNEDDKIIYKLTFDIIEKLKDQGESYLKALAKDLLAEFFLFRNLKVKAKNHWIECLDSIFKQVCVLENFQSLFDSKNSKTDFVATFGQKKLYLALLILYKLSKFIFLNK
jgi:hypothetical protein